MKKFTKRIMALLLIFAMAMSTAILVPETASAATPKSKTKSATLKVTSTKISGFKKIEGTIKVGKYVVAYGKNSKKQNVYSYSSDGKKFSKAKALGLSGEVNYQAAGKYLYVVAKSNSATTYYKCTSSPSKLGSASKQKISISLPSGFTPSETYIDVWGYTNDKTGNIQSSASSYGTVETEYGSNYCSYAYSVVLTPKGAKIVNLTDKAKALLKSDDVSVNSYMDISWGSSSYRACTDVSDSKTGKSYVMITSNGTSFSLTPAIPNSDKASYNTEWVGGKIMAYRTYAYESNGNHKYTMDSDSSNHGKYYLYNTSTKKWETKTTGKYKSSTGFSCSYSGDVSSYYYNTNSDKDYITCNAISGYKIKTIISSNGTSWSALPTLTRNSTKYTLRDIEYAKAPTGTYAVETYWKSASDYANQYIVISKIVSGKWKKIKTINVKRSDSTFDSVQLYSKTPVALYNNGKISTGYNLKTGKSYILPFNYNYNSVMSGDSLTYYSGSKLYRTTDGFKTFTKITLKSGSSTIKSKITETSIHSISKDKVYAYIICGNKMYYTTTKKILSAK